MSSKAYYHWAHCPCSIIRTINKEYDSKLSSNLATSPTNNVTTTKKMNKSLLSKFVCFWARWLWLYTHTLFIVHVRIYVPFMYVYLQRHTLLFQSGVHYVVLGNGLHPQQYHDKRRQEVDMKQSPIEKGRWRDFVHLSKINETMQCTVRGNDGIG